MGTAAVEIGTAKGAVFNTFFHYAANVVDKVGKDGQALWCLWWMARDQLVNLPHRLMLGPQAWNIFAAYQTQTTNLEQTIKTLNDLLEPGKLNPQEHQQKQVRKGKNQRGGFGCSHRQSLAWYNPGFISLP